MTDALFITGLTVHGENNPFKNAGLLIKQGKIEKIVTTAQEKIPHAQTIAFPSSCHLIPGIIDLFAHGAKGADVMDGTAEALETITSALPQEGVTSILAATMTQTYDKIEQAIINAKRFSQQQYTGAEILGVYLEGPFLAPSKAGAQAPHMIKKPDLAIFEHWQNLSDNFIKLATVAPEQEGALNFIEQVQKQGVIVSAAHTDASYEQGLAAIDKGCTHATHLFNAMSGLNHKNPGMAAAALLDDRVSVELIVDGIHLPEANLKLSLKCKPKDKILLVSDAIRAKYLPDGNYELGGQQITVKDSIARTADGALAGSLLKMNEAMRNMQRMTGCDFSDLIRFACENPAKELGIFAHKGSIKVGKDADLTVLDDNFQVLMTIKNGTIIYRR
ncbi:MAG: N-acetylglucosamine-6-phosphate deacetylase [Pseudomonadota bacterium]